MKRLGLQVMAMGLISVTGCTCLVPVEEGGFVPVDDDAGVVTRDAGGVVDGGSDAGVDGGLVTVVVDTSADWLVTGTQPPSGWTTLNFNAQWPRAQLNSGTSAELPFPGIWDGPTVTSGSVQVWFRRVFTLPGDASSAEFFLVCNDDMTVYVNGVKVLEDHDSVSTWSHVDVTATLEPGENVIAATCRDIFGPEHAFHARLTATLW